MTKEFNAEEAFATDLKNWQWDLPKPRRYGLIPYEPKYYPDTMVEVTTLGGEQQMIRYEDLDQTCEWIEATDFGHNHPCFIRGMHWNDKKVCR